MLMSSFMGDIMTNWLELQARAMAVAHFLSNRFPKESAKKIEDLKVKLADSRGALKKVRSQVLLDRPGH